MPIKPFLNSIFLTLSTCCCFGQETKWNGFMDVNTIYEDTSKATSFNLGQLDIYITSEITDRISFLTENTFTYLKDDNFKATIERAIIKYEVNNYLNFLIGKHHTPVSYWNNTYHHGRVLYPTSTRPLLFDYSIFPFHTIGLIISGDYIGKLNFGYQFMVGDETAHGLISGHDKNKSVSLTTHIYPIEDFKVMVSAFADKIPKGIMNHQNVVLTDPVNQTLYSLTLSYLPPSAQGKKVEFLSELMYVRNKALSMEYTNLGLYAYVGYHIGKVTPYYRFDHIDTDPGDPYFKHGVVNASFLGVRYTFNHISNIKLEWNHTDREQAPVYNKINLQFGIGF